MKGGGTYKIYEGECWSLQRQVLVLAITFSKTTTVEWLLLNKADFQPSHNDAFLKISKEDNF